MGKPAKSTGEDIPVRISGFTGIHHIRTGIAYWYRGHYIYGVAGNPIEPQPFATKGRILLSGLLPTEAPPYELNAPDLISEGEVAALEKAMRREGYFEIRAKSLDKENRESNPPAPTVASDRAPEPSVGHGRGKRALQVPPAQTDQHQAMQHTLTSGPEYHTPHYGSHFLAISAPASRLVSRDTSRAVSPDISRTVSPTPSDLVFRNEPLASSAAAFKRGSRYNPQRGPSQGTSAGGLQVPCGPIPGLGSGLSSTLGSTLGSRHVSSPNLVGLGSASRSAHDAGLSHTLSGLSFSYSSTPDLVGLAASETARHASAFLSAPSSRRGSKQYLVQLDSAHGSGASSPLAGRHLLEATIGTLGSLRQSQPPSAHASEPVSFQSGEAPGQDRLSSYGSSRPFRTGSLLRDSEPAFDSVSGPALRHSSVPDIRVEGRLAPGETTLSGFQLGSETHSASTAVSRSPSPFTTDSRPWSHAEVEQGRNLLRQQDLRRPDAESKVPTRYNDDAPIRYSEALAPSSYNVPTIKLPRSSPVLRRVSSYGGSSPNTLSPADPAPALRANMALNEAYNAAQASQLTKCAIHGEDCDGSTVTELHKTEQQRRSSGFKDLYPTIQKGERVMIDWETILDEEVEARKRKGGLV